MYSRIFSTNCFLVILSVSLFLPLTSFADSMTEGLSEETLLQLIQSLMKDGVYSAVEDVATDYLSDFKQGKYREIMLFHRAQARDRGGKDLNSTIADYQQYRTNFPNGKWAQEALYSEGLFRIKNGDHQEAVATLDTFIQKFPQSELIEKAFYLKGKAAFNAANELRTQQTSQSATPWYQKTTSALLAIKSPEILPKEQLVDRFYLLGWSAHYQNKLRETQTWLLKYAEQIDDKSSLGPIYFQLGHNAQTLENYEDATSFFQEVENYPNFQYVKRAKFWQAETLYFIYAKEAPQKQRAEKIIKLYQDYLSTNDQQYQKHAAERIPLLYFQLGQVAAENDQHEEASQFFGKVEPYQNFEYLPQALFLKAESEFQIYTQTPPHETQIAHAEKVVQLFKSYLQTNDTQYKELANTRIPTIYLTLGQTALENKQYQQAQNRFAQVEAYSQFQYLPQALFLKAEAAFIPYTQSPPKNNQLEKADAIIQLYQNYLNTQDQQYRDLTTTRIPTVHFTLGQSELENKNYREAQSRFAQIEKYPNFQFSFQALYLRAEANYLDFSSRPLQKNYAQQADTIIQQYNKYLDTQDLQFRTFAFARIATIYFNLGEYSLRNKKYKDAENYFLKIEDYPNFEYANSALFLKAEARYQMYSESGATQEEAKEIIKLYDVYLKTEDTQYRDIAQSRIPSLYFDLGQKALQSDNSVEAEKFFGNVEKYPDFQYSSHALFLKAEAQYQDFVKNPPEENYINKAQSIIDLFHAYLRTKDTQFVDDVKIRIPTLYFALGQHTLKNNHYQDAERYFTEIETYPTFKYSNQSLFFKAWAHTNNLPAPPTREASEAAVKLYEAYLDTKDKQHQKDARSQITAIYFNLGQHLLESKDFKNAEIYFTKIEAYPDSQYLLQSRFWKAEARYFDYIATPPQNRVAQGEGIIELYQKYLESNDDTYLKMANIRIPTIYFDLGQYTLEEQQFDVAEKYFIQIESYPDFQDLNQAIFFKAEARYRAYFQAPESPGFKSRAEAIVMLFNTYLTTGDSQYQEAANTRIPALFFNVGQNFLNAKNFQEAIHFFQKIETYPNFEYRAQALFLKAEAQYAIYVSKTIQQNKEMDVPPLIKLYESYLNTQDKHYRATASSRIPTIYFNLGQELFEVKQFKKAETYFKKLEEYPNFQYTAKARFWRAETRYSDFLQTPPQKNQAIQAEIIVKLYNQYLETKDTEYIEFVQNRIPGIYLQLGQRALQNKNYRMAIRYFEKTEQFPKFQYSAQAKFLKAEAYNFLNSEKSGKKNSTSELEKTIDLYQGYLATNDQQNRAVALERIPTLYYQLGQNAWKDEDYQGALAAFNQAASYPESSLFAPALFSKAEVGYTISFSDASIPPSPSQIEALISDYTHYLETKHQEFLPHTLYRLGELHANTQQDDQAIEYLQSYLKTGNSEFEINARYRLGILYNQKGNSQQAIQQLEIVQKSPNFQNDATLLQLLTSLYETTGEKEKQQLILQSAKNNNFLSQADRNVFLMKSVETNLNNKQCETILKDLQELPSTQTQDEQHYLLFARGNCFIETQQWEKAKTDILLIQKNPKYEPLVFDMLETVYRELKEHGQLVKHLEAFRIKPNVSFLSKHYQSLINAYHELNNWDLVAATYILWERAFPQDVHKPEILIKWAQAEEHLTFPRSKALYERVLSILDQPSDPFRQTAAIGLLSIYLREKDHQNAARLYENQLIPFQEKFASPPDSQLLNDYYRNLVTIYSQLNQWEKVSLTYSRWEKIDNTSVNTSEDLTNWGQIEEDLSRFTKSQSIYEKALSLLTQPNLRLRNNLVSRLVNLYSKDKNYPAIIKVYETRFMPHMTSLAQSAETSQDLNNHFQLLIATYQELEDWPQVSATYTRWEILFTEDVQVPDHLFNWAQAAEKAGEPEKSRSLFEKTLTLLPDSQLELREEISRYLSNSYLKEEGYQQAATVYETHLMPFLKDLKKHQQYAMLLGKLYFQLQNYEKSQSWFSQVDQNGNSELEIEAVFWLATIEENLNTPQKALQRLTALTTRPLEQSIWYISIHDKLATLHINQEQWEPALKAYRSIVQAPTKQEQDSELQKKAQTQIKEIQTFLDQNNLENLINSQSWKEVAQLIENGLQSGSLQPSQTLYETWLHAEIQQKDWKKASEVIQQGLQSKILQPSKAIYENWIYVENEQKNWQAVLDIYQQLEAIDPNSAKTFQALLHRGQISEQLGLQEKATEFYANALNQNGDTDLESRIFLTEKLRTYYEQKGDYKNFAKIYENTFPFLQKKEDQIRYAYTLGILYLTEIKSQTLAEKWLKTTDKGGTSDMELEAVWQLSELNKEKTPAQATKLLARVASRPISKKAKWYVLINYQLALLYHEQEKYKRAKIHYDRVSKTPTISGYEAYHEDAQKRATSITNYLKSLKTN